MSLAEIGTVCELKVVEIEERIPQLEYGEDIIHLPAIDAPLNVAVGDLVKVFLLYDERGELTATTKIPFVKLHEFHAVKILSAAQAGAFADIGTTRDIFIPTKEQAEELKRGHKCVITIKHDVYGKRLFGSTRIQQYLDFDTIDLERGQEVEALIYGRFREGRKALVNKKYPAVILNNEIVQTIRTGDTVKAYVRKIEGKNLFISTQKEGVALLEDAKAKILTFLNNNGGYARLTDDSDPEEIKIRLRMSKKTFKKAAGMLYKEGKVVITKRGIKIGKGIPPKDPFSKPAAKSKIGSKIKRTDQSSRPSKRTSQNKFGKKTENKNSAFAKRNNKGRKNN